MFASIIMREQRQGIMALTTSIAIDTTPAGKAATRTRPLSQTVKPAIMHLPIF